MKHLSYLGSVNSSAKIAKGEKINVDTFVVYLAPSTLSGYNTCPKASAACIAGCLNTSGRVIMDVKNTIQAARINRTKLFYEDRSAFMSRLIREISAAKRRADKLGHNFAVRLNGTSDISPLAFKYEGKSILDIFPNVQFYDYTKVLNRSNINRPNYDLTFSYSGENWDECEQALDAGLRVAVVFDTKKGMALPETYKGYKVIDGDVTDYRPADDAGVIVGLRFKKIKNKEVERVVLTSNFVINENIRTLQDSI
jgi:hypothetical protein